LWIISFLIAYPLSFGPVVWLDYQGHLSGTLKNVVSYFYHPLNYLLIKSETAMNLMNWYLGLFGI